MKFSKISLFTIFSLAILSACHKKKAEKEESVKYLATTPMVLDTSYNKDYIAQLQSLKNIELRAQEKGYLQSIFVDEGQYVHAGQLLFKVMPKMYEAEVYKAKANVLKANSGILKAKAEVKMSETELLNTKSLANKEIVSKSEQTIAESKLESAKSELSAAYSELESAKAELNLAEIHLSLTNIKAPFDGIIDRIPHKLGSLIEEGELLTTLSDNKNIYAYFNFTEIEYLGFKTKNKDNNKLPVGLTLANNEPYNQEGVIETIEGEFDNNTGTVAVRAKYPNPNLLLKHGETGKVNLAVDLKNVIVIPQKATYELQDKIYVYVIDEKNIVHSKNVVIQQKLNNLYVIASGLNASDKILLEGLQTVKEDEKIEYELKPANEVINSLQLIKN